eukprot:11173095-Lingulodinium_polyedra.AAC.1
MALAGTYHMTDERFFAPLDPLVRHLSQAEAYVVRHTTGQAPCADSLVLEILRTADEAIRSEWARLLRASDKPVYGLGDAAKDTEAYAASVWLQKPIRAQAPAGVAQPPRQERSRSRARRRNRTRRGRSPTPEKAVLKPADRAQNKPPKGGGKGIKTCKLTTDGKIFCKPFNDARGCTNERCPMDHKCD